MEQTLRKHFSNRGLEECGYWCYQESVSPDALTSAWLDNRTSYIWKVGVLTVIDSNKCDWVHLVVGMQRDDKSDPIIIGELYFPQGENDDIARVLQRTIELLKPIHPVFDPY